MRATNAGRIASFLAGIGHAAALAIAACSTSPGTGEGGGSTSSSSGATASTAATTTAVTDGSSSTEATTAAATTVASGSTSAGDLTGGDLELGELAAWTRHPDNPIFLGNSFAADPHVWEESPGQYRMVYTDAVEERQAIAMATSTDLVSWTPIANAQYPDGVVLAGAGPGGQDLNQETAVYRRTDDGQHQIFYIGYADEIEYHTAIYKAEASEIEGPYLREADPVIPWTPGGPDSFAMTSPTIVEHNGQLFMTYIGWQSYPDGPVINVGATSDDDGRTWDKHGELSWDDIFGVEAHTEPGPDGLFYRVGITGDTQGGDVITLGRAPHPFGPFTTLAEPILVPGGARVGEGDTIMSPTLMFRDDIETAYMLYAAVDTGGWPWVTSLASCDYGG